MLDNKQTNHRVSSEWYVCDRCGFQYPRVRVMNQNGLNLCMGPNTNDCLDKPGAGALRLFLDVPYEQRPEPLPDRNEDL